MFCSWIVPSVTFNTPKVFCVSVCVFLHAFLVPRTADGRVCPSIAMKDFHQRLLTSIGRLINLIQFLQILLPPMVSVCLYLLNIFLGSVRTDEVRPSWWISIRLCHRSFNKFRKWKWIQEQILLPLNVLPPTDLCVWLFVCVCPSGFGHYSVFRNYYSEIGICKLEIVQKIRRCPYFLPFVGFLLKFEIFDPLDCFQNKSVVILKDLHHPESRATYGKL
jgi:hypothetical protein